MKRFSFLILFVFLSTFAQEKTNFYVRYSSYDTVIQQEIKENSHFDYFVLTPGYFLKKNSEEVDDVLLNKTLNKWFPQDDSTTYLVIDWEKDYFKTLKKGSKNDKDFLEAEKGFLGLIESIRKLKPNLKIGYYGIPYRFNYDFQKVKDNQKFFKILEQCDFIAPSLYLSFIDYDRNIRFLKENMEQAFVVGKALDKPVIPFFWYLYVNQKETVLIEKSLMDNYLTFIKEFKFEGKKIEGIFWWDSASITSVFENKAARSNSINKREDILKYYNLISK